MFLPEPSTIDVTPDLSGFDESVLATPAEPAVFLVRLRDGARYWGRTASLRRRLTRLLCRRDGPSRSLSLRSLASRIEYWVTRSRLESSLYSYELVRRSFPDAYREQLKLRMPHYVKLILTNSFPRTQVTARLTASRSLFYGPFGTRAAAERFEGELLDLFQIRRCQEDLAPSLDHPGCIYGEMNRCLRPCQQVVGADEYGAEVARAGEFLSSRGASLVRSVAAARDRLSEELDFEEAARQHARLERIQQAIRLSDDLGAEIGCLNGVAVTPSSTAGIVQLWFLLSGAWQAPRRFALYAEAGKPTSLDKRLRELISGIQPAPISAAERQDHLALLARWYHSSWRDGEWLALESLDLVPYRKLVNAIHRVATAASSFVV